MLCLATINQLRGFINDLLILLSFLGLMVLKTVYLITMYYMILLMNSAIIRVDRADGTKYL